MEDSQYVPIGEKLLPKYRFLWTHFFDSNKNIFISRIFAQFFETLEKPLFLLPCLFVLLLENGSLHSHNC